MLAYAKYVKCFAKVAVLMLQARPVVPKVGGAAPSGAGCEAEMGGWGAIGDPVNNYISVVLLPLCDQML